MTRLFFTWIGLASLVASAAAVAQVNTPASYEAFQQDLVQKTKRRVEPALVKYCQGACEIINVRVAVNEELPETVELGFEGISGGGSELNTNFVAEKITVELQIDDRVTSVNRSRLRSIILNQMRPLAVLSDVVWNPVRLPQIGTSDLAAEQLKESLRTKIQRRLQKVADKYCPNDCILSQINVDGRLVSPDEAAGYSRKALVRGKNTGDILLVEDVGAEINFNEEMSENLREKIIRIMQARTRFLEDFQLSAAVSPFPETYAERQQRLAEESADPYGLERLRRTLQIFKELAGTKEIITTRESESLEKSSLESNSSNSSSLNATTKSSLESKALSELTAKELEQQSLTESSSSADPLTYGLYFGGFLLLAGIIVALIMRFAGANRDAQVMMAAADPYNGMGARAGASAGMAAGDGAAHGGFSGGPSGDQNRDQELAHKLRLEAIRDELIRNFMDTPKVAKETFSRLIREEGVEETAKYVHILGQLVVFELLDDPTLQRELYSLSEYYHKSNFKFDFEEQLELLQILKTKVTAAEIRVMTRKRMEKFDFLNNLDANQVYTLISDEKPQVQSIVLTQLDHKRRSALFDLYEGENRVHLLQELCRADAIPKEFLANVATALHKKVTSRPEFDTENLRSNDILLDLLEKSDLEDQRSLMRHLEATNPDASRAIKIKFVTIEMLHYLKDGHLLELILGIERTDLLTFLLGTEESIRNLLLSKAPAELSESWMEDLQAMAGVDEDTFNMTEMKIVSRIRSLANTGAINLVDINNMIFNTDAATQEEASSEDRLRIAPQNLVA